MLNDEELKALRKELEETKGRLRNEIKDERAKAEQIKVLLREDVSIAKETATNKKAEYALEVLEARKSSREEIEKSRK